MLYLSVFFKNKCLTLQSFVLRIKVWMINLTLDILIQALIVRLRVRE